MFSSKDDLDPCLVLKALKMSEIIQKMRQMALDDAKTFSESSDIAKRKKNFALRILSNASNRFVDKCRLIASAVDKLPAQMHTAIGVTASSQCDLLSATLQDVKTETTSTPPEPFDVGILKATNSILADRNQGPEKLDKPELYQYYLSRALRMRKMLSGMELYAGEIAKMIEDRTLDKESNDGMMAFSTHVSVINMSYASKIVTAMESLYKRLENSDVEATSNTFEVTLKEIQAQYQAMERILMNLTIVREGLSVLNPFLILHNKLAGTLGVPVWHGTDEEWNATKLHKVVKGDKWKRMESKSGLPLDDGIDEDTEEPFRLNPYHTYLLLDPQQTARDFSQAMDETYRYLQKLQSTVKGKKKAGCKTNGEASKIEYVFVDMNAMKRALASRRRGGSSVLSGDDDIGMNPAPFPNIYRPPVHLTQGI